MEDSTSQAFNLHPRFGHISRIHLQMWVVRDSNPRPGDSELSPKSAEHFYWKTDSTNVGICTQKGR